MEPAREESSPASGDLVAAFGRASLALRRARERLSDRVFGQPEAVDLALAVAVAGGGAVVAGPTGSGKTRVVEAIGLVLGLPVGRARLSPEVELSELIGETDGGRVEAEGGQRRLRGPAGALFHPILLAEDLDRAAPRVRAALLEAMHEGQIVVGGVSHRLPRPFCLFATTTGDAGGLGLDETSLDRFLAQVDTGAPDRGGERRLLIESAGRGARAPEAAMDAAGLLEAQRVAVELPVGEKVVESILDLVRRARPDDPSAPALVREAVERGPGPRAGQALMRLARARALIDGRASPSQADVKALAPAVLRPRLGLKPGAKMNDVLAAIVG